MTPELWRCKRSAKELSNNHEIVLCKLVLAGMGWCRNDIVTLSNTHCINISQHLTKVGELRGEIPLSSSIAIKKKNLLYRPHSVGFYFQPIFWASWCRTIFSTCFFPFFCCSIFPLFFTLIMLIECIVKEVLNMLWVHFFGGLEE